MEQIGVGGVQINKQARKYVNEVLKSNRLSYGPYIKAFEFEFAKLHDLKFAAFMNSGTSALQVAINALKIKYDWQDGDEVLCPATTFVASANTIIQNNLKVIFVDVEPDYFMIDPEKIEEKITPQTKAIMVVHLCGQMAQMDKIMEIANKHNLKVIEDACEAVYAHYKGKTVGSFGDVSCFSTYTAHTVTTGVGGFACTNNLELATLIRSLMNHGRDGIYISIDDDGNISKELINKRFAFPHIGYSYRATEMEGAIGLAQLEILDWMIQKRKENATFLTEHLSKLSFLKTPKVREEHTFMMYPLIAEGIKDELTLYLEENNIETRPLLPLINQPIYHITESFPVSQYLIDNAFYIGCHPYLTQKELKYIVKVFNDYDKSL